MRLELMHFLTLLGTGKVGAIGWGENIQPTGQQCTEVSPASDCIPGFPCDSFCPAELHKEHILSLFPSPCLQMDIFVSNTKECCSDEFLLLTSCAEKQREKLLLRCSGTWPRSFCVFLTLCRLGASVFMCFWF